MQLGAVFELVQIFPRIQLIVIKLHEENDISVRLIIETSVDFEVQLVSFEAVLWEVTKRSPFLTSPRCVTSPPPPKKKAALKETKVQLVKISTNSQNCGT